jgi:hypothetical protein
MPKELFVYTPVYIIKIENNFMTKDKLNQISMMRKGGGGPLLAAPLFRRFHRI